MDITMLIPLVPHIAPLLATGGVWAVISLACATAAFVMWRLIARLQKLLDAERTQYHSSLDTLRSEHRADLKAKDEALHAANERHAASLEAAMDKVIEGQESAIEVVREIAKVVAEMRAAK
jgi:G:T/U-mismatch repair DNA glycosylase